LFGSPSVAKAQVAFLSGGTSTNTTPSQQTAINQASNYLTGTGENLSGITITAANLGTHSGEWDPATNTIGVDFDRIDSQIPPGTSGAEGYPGIVLFIILHELQHSNHGVGNTPCDELTMVKDVAAIQCEFICLVAAAGGPTAALCKMYEIVRERHTAARPLIVAAGCPDPGAIPACPCC